MNAPLPEFVVEGDGDHTLVFLHGLGGDHTNWKPQFDHFASRYRCLAWTLPGFGTSPALPSLTWPDLSDALARVLNAASIERASIVGLSMGGYIAQQFAADHNERVDKLVLAATSAHFGRGSESFAQRFLEARLSPLDNGQTPADLAPTVVAGLLSNDAPAGAADNCVRSMSRISPTAYRRALECLVTWDFRNHLSEIGAPTLCVAGGEDQTAPVPALEALASGLQNATVETIEGCNHLINLDRPNEFNALVRAFIESE